MCLRFCLACLVSFVCFAALPLAMAGPGPNQPPEATPTSPPAPAGSIAFTSAVTVTSELSGSLRLGLQRLNGQDGPVSAQVQVVGGTATADDYRLPSGSLDPQFLSGLSGGNQPVTAVVQQPDGKILVGGDFTGMNGTARNRIARLNADGTLDTSFDPASGANGRVEAIALQSDGKLLIGGEFTQVAGVGRSRIARLNADGTLDSSFNPGALLDGPVWELIVQPDGQVLASGQFPSLSSQRRLNLVRLNADGSQDTSFSAPASLTPSSSYVLPGLALQSDGKIIIGGTFRLTISGGMYNTIARLQADGSLDSSFNVRNGADAVVREIRLQPDGKVVATGNFTTFNGQPRRGITRLNSDGTLDPTFNPGAGAATNGPAAQVTAIGLQPDGRIVIGGDFVRFNNIARGGIARLNADGSLDSSFEPASGANSRVIDLAMQPDGNLVIGGEFTSVNGTPRGRIARLLANETAAPPTVVWEPGDVGERSIVLQLVNDSLPEWNETLVLAFTPAGGASVGEPAQMTITFQSEERPELIATPQSVIGEENRDLVLQLGSNMPATEPALYRIVSLPERGTLFQYDNGSRGAEISSVPAPVSDLEGRLIFAPLPDTVGTPYASFSFQVQDRTGRTGEASVTIVVTAAAAPPVSPSPTPTDSPPAPTPSPGPSPAPAPDPATIRAYLPLVRR